MSKIDPLAAWVQQSPVQALIAATILLVFCALLVAFGRQQRRLGTMQRHLDKHSSDIRRLEVAHEGLLVRFMNLPRWNKVPNGSSSDMPQEKTTSSVDHPTQPDEKSSKVPALYAVAPKASPE